MTAAAKVGVVNVQATQRNALPCTDLGTLNIHIARPLNGALA
jgi:hypothetical protein